VWRPAGPVLALLGVTLVATLTATRPAHGAPSEGELQSARELFAAAERDEDAGSWADARGKLERVAALKLTAGVRYHLALCDEHLGHLRAKGIIRVEAHGRRQARYRVLNPARRATRRRSSAVTSGPSQSPPVDRLTVHLDATCGPSQSPLSRSRGLRKLSGVGNDVDLRGEGR